MKLSKELEMERDRLYHDLIIVQTKETKHAFEVAFEQGLKFRDDKSNNKQ